MPLPEESGYPWVDLELVMFVLESSRVRPAGPGTSEDGTPSGGLKPNPQGLWTDYILERAPLAVRQNLDALMNQTVKPLPAGIGEGPTTLVAVTTASGPGIDVTPTAGHSTMQLTAAHQPITLTAGLAANVGPTSQSWVGGQLMRLAGGVDQLLSRIGTTTPK